MKRISIKHTDLLFVGLLKKNIRINYSIRIFIVIKKFNYYIDKTYYL